jgi:hypothetical protein
MINLKLQGGKDETNDRLPYTGCRRAVPAANAKYAQSFFNEISARSARVVRIAGGPTVLRSHTLDKESTQSAEC